MTDESIELVLHGGVANAGAVVRVGDHVLRPSNPHSPSIHRMLRSLAEAGFDGASVPVGIDPDGRERLVFIPGDVAIPPYPTWVQSDAALGSIARLLRRMHDVSTVIEFDADASWSAEMADTIGGDVFCHNDVCLENVVFRDGSAVGLLDFDFAAPGRREFDLASFVRMCLPVDEDASAARLGWVSADRPARLRLVCDEYGLDGPGRARLLDRFDESIARDGQFVRRRVEAGEAAFIEMWESMGGQERYDRRRRWWSEVRADFEGALR
ncbi:MAG: phosphotransferase [Actinobacteria bacterium]|nr:phosphotransferase [Actinomycetota bacterium]